MNQPIPFDQTPQETPVSREDFRDYLKKTILFSVLFILSVIQFGTWGRDSASIVYYKSLEILSVANAQQLKALSEICLEHKRFGCVTDAFNQLAIRDPSPQTLVTVGDHHRRFGRHQIAAPLYRKGTEAMNLGNSNPDLAVKLWYGLGQSLEAIGQNEAAADAYHRALLAKPEVIQMTVTEAYFKLLQKMNQRDIAESVIREARMRGNSDALFSHLLKSK
jgi:hypothetical protein